MRDFESYVPGFRRHEVELGPSKRHEKQYEPWILKQEIQVEPWPESLAMLRRLDKNDRAHDHGIESLKKEISAIKGQIANSHGESERTAQSDSKPTRKHASK